MAGTHEPVAVLGTGAMGHGMAVSAQRAGIPTIESREPRDLGRCRPGARAVILSVCASGSRAAPARRQPFPPF
jgi:hypothetical protein